MHRKLPCALVLLFNISSFPLVLFLGAFCFKPQLRRLLLILHDVSPTLDRHATTRTDAVAPQPLLAVFVPFLFIRVLTFLLEHVSFLVFQPLFLNLHGLAPEVVIFVAKFSPGFLTATSTRLMRQKENLHRRCWRDHS